MDEQKHDDLCPYEADGLGVVEWCHCTLIAKVRAEYAEDGWELEVARKRGRREVAEEIAQAIEMGARERWTTGKDWVAVAAQIAREGSK